MRIRANPVVADGKEAGICPIPAHGNPDGASLRVVQDAVLQQIGQRAQKQPLVPLQADGFVHLLQFYPAGIFRHRVHKIGHGAADELCRAQPLAFQGLHVVFQAGHQVQVADQVAQADPLPADHRGLLLLRRRECGIVLQFARIAEDHGEGRADVVRDARDPVGARLVLFPQRVVAALQFAGSRVDPSRHLAQAAALRQLHRFPARQAGQPVQNRAYRPHRPPAEECIDQDRHQDIAHQEQQHTFKDRPGVLLCKIERVAHIRPLGVSGHHQAVRVFPAKDGVIL